MAGLALAAAAAAFQPKTVLSIDPRHRLIEGVASDGQTIWVSSVLDRQVLACRKTCRIVARLPAPLHPFAIAWDSHRKRLWVAADCPRGVAAIKPCSSGALLALDRNGRVRVRVAPRSATFHPGDVSASPQGVFVSDSQNGAVYRLAATGRGLRTLVAAGIGKSAQGSAVDEEGKRLIVADYSQGVGAIDLATGQRTIFTRQDGKPLRGVDGLTRCGGSYFAVYNGETPGRLVSFFVGADLGSGQLTLDDPHPGDILPDPTQVALDGRRILVVADSGWATLDKPGFVRRQGATIIAIPVPGGCDLE